MRAYRTAAQRDRFAVCFGTGCAHARLARLGRSECDGRVQARRLRRPGRSAYCPARSRRRIRCEMGGRIVSAPRPPPLGAPFPSSSPSVRPYMSSLVPESRGACTGTCGHYCGTSTRNSGRWTSTIFIRPPMLTPNSAQSCAGTTCTRASPSSMRRQDSQQYTVYRGCQGLSMRCLSIPLCASLSRLLQTRVSSATQRCQ